MEFLQKVKAERFARSLKKYGNNPYSESDRNWKTITTDPNDKPDRIFTVVGKTKIQEGFTAFDSDEGHYWCQKKSHTVYQIADGLGRMYKALPEDLESVGEETEE